MTSPAVSAAGAARGVPRGRRVADGRFYSGMALAIALTVFAGFARTYYLRPYFQDAPLVPLLHLHGIIFTAWVLLFAAQTTLVAARRTALHRRLGMASVVLVPLMLAVGATTAVVRAKQGFAPPGGPPPRVFLVIPIMDLVVFGSLAGAGFYLRRRPEAHKRLMLLATIALLAAPIARLTPGIMRAGPPAFFGLADLFLVACVGYDLISRRRVERPTLWGGGLILASQPLRLWLGGTAGWLAFATWLTR